MDDADFLSTPIADLVACLAESLDEAFEEGPEGFAMIECMRIAMPVEFYVRSDFEGEQRVTRIESRPASGTLTSFMPVLHGFWLVAEVDRAEQRESGVEP